MTRELKAYRERKKILEALWLSEGDMERMYRELGKDEKFIQDMKTVREVLDMQLFVWKRAILWRLAAAALAVLTALAAGAIAAGL